MIMFACPYCLTLLELVFVSEYSNWFCPICHEEFKSRNGIHYLHKDDDSWREVEKEANGTIECLKEDNAYNEEDCVGVDKYPYFEKREHSTDINRVMFDMSKKLIGKKRGALLEIGAKNCWAVNQFLKLGFTDVFATDISDDDKTALGWVVKLEKYTGRKFEKVICDGAYLPFENNQFDVIFSCSTFHHIREKQNAMSEIYRVLKKDGIYVSMGDNPRHPERSIEDALGPVKREREKFYINETQPTMDEYYLFFDRAGFEDYYMYPFDENLLKNNWDFDRSDMIDRILELGKLQKEHRCFKSLFSNFSSKTQMLFSSDRVIMLNYWLHIPSNVVMWGIK